ncbi:hypothetical protein [Candidatus Ichthyocystis sparus]|uniref:hypothetical protein n=1 Tax=Candidatus Ichthyocystis sparus TaxID=1561004 RepID=UPI00159ED7D4|nr:hypothetical protein [Candidatus Ichthyocystis sparus]
MISVLSESPLMVDFFFGVTVVVVVVDKSSWFGVSSTNWIHVIRWVSQYHRQDNYG